jgi:hypothetical protein
MEGPSGSPPGTAPPAPAPRAGKRRLPSSGTIKLAVTFVVGAGVALLAAFLLLQILEEEPMARTVDTPPAEFLYLDAARVPGYLGQLVGGLSESEKQTDVESKNLTSKLVGGGVGEVEAVSRQERGVEKVVSPTASDRFYRLLQYLLEFEKEGAATDWLAEVDARLGEGNSIEQIIDTIKKVREGEFLRIKNAQLFLPPYAAVKPKVRYASSYLGGEIEEPERPLYAPISRRERAAVKRYLKLLGKNPRLPFVVPTLSQAGDDKQVVTFFVPTQYIGLVNEPRLLAGNLTVLGKVIYKDPRLAGDETCDPKVSLQPCSYFDTQTLGTYGAALEKAPESVLRNLRMKRNEVVGSVRASVTFDVPIVVVIPLAIYQ